MSQDQQNKRIDYIEFPVTDVEAAKRFYGQAFGWKFEDYGPDYASFAHGRLTGGFRQESKVQGGGPLVVIYAVELEKVQAEVKAAGGKLKGEIFSFPGGRRLHFQDPAGHELAVWSDR